MKAAIVRMLLLIILTACLLAFSITAILQYALILCTRHASIKKCIKDGRISVKRIQKLFEQRSRDHLQNLSS